MKRYQIHNWSQYNKSLIQRGSITLWISEETASHWYSTTHTRERGRPEVYSNDAILCALLIRTAFRLPLRALQGFLSSIIVLMKLSLRPPSYTQICRRACDLRKHLRKLSSRLPRDIVFDSTGLKVYGEGEWKVRQHGASKRRVWRKLHIGLDPDSGEIIVAEMTDNGIGSGDGVTAKELMKKLPKGVKRVFGDGAYDGFEFRRTVERAGAVPIVPPPRDAVVHASDDTTVRSRNDSILEIMGLGGDDEARRLWKVLKGYHKRSLVETTMYRIKQLTGGELRSREWERQCTESYIKCLYVNKITKLGMPKGQWKQAA